MANENIHTNLEQLGLLASRTKGAIPTKVSDLTNDSGFQTAAEVSAAINEKIGSAYKIKGSKTFAELTPELLVAANEGNVYNISNAFTTNANFVEGAGKKHPAGTNVVVVNNGTDETPDYKFDVFGGDLSGFAELVSGAVNGNLAGLNASGQPTDSGIAASNVVTKVANATAGDIATLNAAGEVTDSGIASADVAMKVSGATNGNLAGLNGSGEPIDSGIAASTVATKVANATAGNFASLDANGNIADSGTRMATNQEVNTLLDSIFGPAS